MSEMVFGKKNNAGRIFLALFLIVLLQGGIVFGAEGDNANGGKNFWKDPFGFIGDQFSAGANAQTPQLGEGTSSPFNNAPKLPDEPETGQQQGQNNEKDRYDEKLVKKEEGKRRYTIIGKKGKIENSRGIWDGIQPQEDGEGATRKSFIEFDEKGDVREADFRVEEGKEGKTFNFGDDKYYAPPGSRVKVETVKVKNEKGEDVESQKVTITLKDGQTLDLDEKGPERINREEDDKALRESEVEYEGDAGKKFRVKKDGKEVPINFLSMGMQWNPKTNSYLTFSSDNFDGQGLNVAHLGNRNNFDPVKGISISPNQVNKRVYLGFDGKVPDLPERGGSYLSFGDKNLVSGSTNDKWGPKVELGKDSPYLNYQIKDAKGNAQQVFGDKDRLAFMVGPESKVSLINKQAENELPEFTTNGKVIADIGKEGFYVNDNGELMMNKAGSLLKENNEDFSDATSPLVRWDMNKQDGTPIRTAENSREGRGLVFNHNNQAVFIGKNEYATVTFPGQGGGHKAKIKLYSADWCGPCLQLKNKLKAQGLKEGVDFEVVNVDKISAAEKERIGLKGVPYLTEDGRRVDSLFDSDGSLNQDAAIQRIRNNVVPGTEGGEELFSSRFNYNLLPQQPQGQVNPQGGQGVAGGGFGGGQIGSGQAGGQPNNPLINSIGPDGRVQAGGVGTPAQSSARLTIRDTTGPGFGIGSGTYIGRDDKYGYILTAGHNFVVGGRKQIGHRVEIENINKQRTTGELVKILYSQQTSLTRNDDLALVRIPLQSANLFKSASLPPQGFSLRQGDQLTRFGCPYGSSSIRRSSCQVYQVQPASVLTNNPPKQGESGGGIFDRNGRLVGVTSTGGAHGGYVNNNVISKFLRDNGLGNLIPRLISVFFEFDIIQEDLPVLVVR